MEIKKFFFWFLSVAKECHPRGFHSKVHMLLMDALHASQHTGLIGNVGNVLPVHLHGASKQLTSGGRKAECRVALQEVGDVLAGLCVATSNAIVLASQLGHCLGDSNLDLMRRPRLAKEEPSFVLLVVHLIEKGSADHATQ